MKRLTGVFVDVVNEKIELKTLETNDGSMLDEYYKLLNCRNIDIVQRKIGGKHYDIICDDEGLLFEDWKPAMAIVDENSEIKQLLAGNLFIVLNDNQGNLRSLTKEDAVRILQEQAYLQDKNTGAKRLVLVGAF